jgi:hypothetical protein
VHFKIQGDFAATKFSGISSSAFSELEEDPIVDWDFLLSGCCRKTAFAVGAALWISTIVGKSAGNFPLRSIQGSLGFYSSSLRRKRQIGLTLGHFKVSLEVAFKKVP